MRFLVDEQLPPALAAMFVEFGCAAQHVRDIGLGGLDDDFVWQHALANNAIMVTKDADFVIRRSLYPDGPAVVWLRLGNTRKLVLLATVKQALPEILDALNRGERLVQLWRSEPA